MSARALVLLLAVVSLAMQQQTPDKDLPEVERQIPMGDYCKREGVRITPKETHAHSCSCTFSCTVDPNSGEIQEHETANCKAYCQKNGRRCTCHTEEPCPEPGANALMDMDGHIVAMLKESK